MADVQLGGTSGFCGVLYAPNAQVNIAGNTQIWGAVTAKDIVTAGCVEVHYDLALAQSKIMVAPFRVINQSRDVFCSLGVTYETGFDDSGCGLDSGARSRRPGGLAGGAGQEAASEGQVGVGQRRLPGTPSGEGREEDKTCNRGREKGRTGGEAQGAGRAGSTGAKRRGLVAVTTRGPSKGNQSPGKTAQCRCHPAGAACHQHADPRKA